MNESPTQFTHDDYTVGWICALPDTELVVAGAMLDHEHPVLSAADPQDTNSYLFGSVGRHNVVIACLPAESTGKVSAATVATNMLRSFKAVRFGLMVGIGGGVPYYGSTVSKDSDNESENDESDSDDGEDIKDIRLGDVVIGLHSKAAEAVIQYDFGKSEQKKKFFYAGGRLNKPPNLVLNAVSMLRGQHIRKGHNITEVLSAMLANNPGMGKHFSRPGPEKDNLFKSDVIHVEGRKSCKACRRPDDGNLVTRNDRFDNAPQLHYGTIGSADQVMRDAILRDKLAQQQNILCFEMEAAGLMDAFPCLVIRGISDYADSHKNKAWQPYSASVAAAYAKELLYVIPAQEVMSLSPIRQIMQKLELGQQILRDTNAHVREMKADQYAQRIERWLSPADPSTNMNTARKSRQPGTGKWFLQSKPFREWEHGSRQCLWLYGMPGCGKTVLSVTILDHIAEINNTTVLYFFFDFTDAKKQRLDDMLCSLIFQLSCLRPDSRRTLDSLFSSHQDGRTQPDTDKLVLCLNTMIQDEKILVLIDALDECSERPKLLSWLEDFIPALANVQLLSVSRPEDDINSSLRNLIGDINCISLNKTSINDDIGLYVHTRLHMSQEFERWAKLPQVRDSIETALSSKADGLFRWAACQLDRVKECLDREAVEDTLQSLPSDLNTTYARILENIPPEIKKKSMRLLQFLVHSERPLSLREAVDVIAVRIDPGSFNTDDRLPWPEEITKFCSSLVLLLGSLDGEEEPTVQLAHFSVKEYLENCSVSGFSAIERMTSITQVCLNYLGSIHSDGISSLAVQYPLQGLAAAIWMDGARHAEGSVSGLETILKFIQNEKQFRLWIDLATDEESWWPDTVVTSRVTPLYFACLLGLEKTAGRLISNGADVNAQGGWHGTALQAASGFDRREIIQLVLDNGADINAQGGHFGYALQAALCRGHEPTIRLLLDKGADINAQGGHYGNALQAASLAGHEPTIRLLLDKGADINAQGGQYGNALQAASSQGHETSIKLLLDGGAAVNTQGGHFGNALQAASYHGHEATVKLLLDGGAAVNAQGRHGNAIQAASYRWHEATVGLLLDYGAHLANTDNHGSTLLHTAITNPVVLKQLLLRGANPNVKDRCGRTPLVHAAARGDEWDCIQLLLEHGALVGAQDNYGCTALQAAVKNGHTDVAKILLAREDGDLDAVDAMGRSVSWWAAKTGNTEIMDILAQRGLVATELTAGDALTVLFTIENDKSWRICDTCLRGISVEVSYYHCGTCDGGDFDICLDCYEGGLRCHEKSHTLTLSIKNG